MQHPNQFLHPMVAVRFGAANVFVSGTWLLSDYVQQRSAFFYPGVVSHEMYNNNSMHNIMCNPVQQFQYGN